MTELSGREQIIQSVKSRLGFPMIEIELSDTQYEECVNRALRVLRQRSEASQEESYMFLTLEEDKNEYILPDEVLMVKEIHRRSFSSIPGGAKLDPFAVANANLYLLPKGSSQVHSLATHELYHQYLETAGKMFGRFINFKFYSRTHKLLINQKPRSNEEVLLHVWNYIPEDVIMDDYKIYPWLEDWALAEAKETLGQIRGKYSQIPGPDGSNALNGEVLKNEAFQEKEKLLLDLKNFVDGSIPLFAIIG